jgi:hypothetical protein
MTRIESRLYQKAASPFQTNLNPRDPFRRLNRLLAGLLNSYFYKLHRLALAKSLLPIVEKRIPQPTVTTERRNSLAALTLLRY